MTADPRPFHDGAPTAEDARAVEQLARSQAAIVRPTPAPFGWAENYACVGITGTNGKTSTTVFITSIFRAAGRSTMSGSTLGFDLDGETVGEVRSTLAFLSALYESHQKGCRHGVFELTSEALALGYARLWRFDIGVFTNLSRDHLASHGSWEHYLASKAQLFVHLGPEGVAVLNASDETSMLIDQVIAPDVRRLWYASPTRGPALRTPDLAARSIDVTPDGTTTELEPGDLSEALGGSLRVPLVGHVFAENALAAAAAGHAAGVEPAVIRQGLENAPVTPGRFEVVAREPVVAVDFAHTPDALARTCETARALAGDHKLLVVFGAGGNRDPEKREPMGRVVGELADTAIVTNDNPRTEDPKAIAKAVTAGCRRGGRAYVRTELDRKRAIVQALEMAGPSDVVLIAGKGHEDGQEIGTETLPFSDTAVAKEALGFR